MTRTYAQWVAPIAARREADARELIEFARAAPAAFWDRASLVDGWTNRDVLAHCSCGNDQMLQFVLRAVVSSKPLGPETFDIDTDRANERGVVERRFWPIERLIRELEESADEVQELLAQLRDEHRDARAGAFTLPEFLGAVQEERHDREHMLQLREGLYKSRGA